jgi:hypothetical protein
MEIEITNSVVENKDGPLKPSPDENIAKFAPNNTTWKDMMAFTRLLVVAIPASPMKNNAAEVTWRIC